MKITLKELFEKYGAVSPEQMEDFIRDIVKQEISKIDKCINHIFSKDTEAFSRHSGGDKIYKRQCVKCGAWSHEYSERYGWNH